MLAMMIPAKYGLDTIESVYVLLLRITRVITWNETKKLVPLEYNTKTSSRDASQKALQPRGVHQYTREVLK